MPVPPPRDLTIPEPGSRTAREVLSLSMRAALEDLGRVSRLAPPSARAEAAALDRMLLDASKRAPGALVSAFRRPTVSGVLRCLVADPTSDALWIELVAELAFGLAVAGVLASPVRLARVPPRLLSIPARLALAVEPGARAVVFESGHVRIERAGSVATVDLASPVSAPGVTVERPFHTIAGEIVLALADNNPLASVEAHPDKSGNALDLGGRSPEAWTCALAAALAPVAEQLPDLRAEMDLFVTQIVPVGWDAEKHLSASYQEVVGTLYMTLHPSGMTLSEALIHEFSHNKLNALFALDPVLENAWSPLYTSPVRPDPRPLHGVLLAVHAFLPVARLYERMTEARVPIAARDDFRARFAAIRRINREGAELLLREARPTTVGAALLEEIRRWHEHYAAYDD
jgi:HEXXH motif-containing protein